MTQLLTRLRARLTYGNITATLALFVALGGTSYAALTLPRNSVGSTQIRTNAVSSSEIRSRAVGSSELRDRAIRLSDLSVSARASLRGVQGPAGPAGPRGASAITYRAAINHAGGRAGGNARDAGHTLGSNEYTVEFPGDIDGVDVSKCIYSATLAAVQNGSTVDQPPAGGTATVAPVSATRVLVKTYAAGAALSPVEAPFHLIVAC